MRVRLSLRVRLPTDITGSGGLYCHNHEGGGVRLIGQTGKDIEKGLLWYAVFDASLP
jgi:hypothetical protein